MIGIFVYVGKYRILFDGPIFRGYLIDLCDLSNEISADAVGSVPQGIGGSPEDPATFINPHHSVIDLVLLGGRNVIFRFLGLVIAVMIVNFGFIAGMAIGIVIGCSTFAFSASRVSVIKFRFDGTEYRSSLDRSAGDMALLARHGGEIQGMSLQSYLFFGSANRLYVY